MIVFVLFAIAALWFLLAGCTFRISRWHGREADYWYLVAAEVQVDPSLDDKYLPLLEWVKANRPSLTERLMGWRSPEERRQRSFSRLNQPTRRSKQ